jgi:hypothetical protein
MLRDPQRGAHQTVRLVLRSSGIKTVTSVCSAIDRILPVITPNIAKTMKTHNKTLAGLVKVCSAVS